MCAFIENFGAKSFIFVKTKFHWMWLGNYRILVIIKKIMAWFLCALNVFCMYGTVAVPIVWPPKCFVWRQPFSYMNIFPNEKKYMTFPVILYYLFISSRFLNAVRSSLLAIQTWTAFENAVRNSKLIIYIWGLKFSGSSTGGKPLPLWKKWWCGNL